MSGLPAVVGKEILICLIVLFYVSTEEEQLHEDMVLSCSPDEGKTKDRGRQSSKWLLNAFTELLIFCCVKEDGESHGDSPSHRP